MCNHHHHLTHHHNIIKNILLILIKQIALKHPIIKTYECTYYTLNVKRIYYAI